MNPELEHWRFAIWDSFSQDKIVAVAHLFAETRFDAEYIFLHGVLPAQGLDYWKTSYTVNSYTEPNFKYLQPAFYPQVSGEGFGSSITDAEVTDPIPGAFVPFSILAHQRLSKLTLLSNSA